MKHPSTHRRIRNALLAIALGIASVGSATAATNDAVSKHVSISGRALQHFSASHSLEDLNTAIDTMQSALDINAFTPQNFIADRRTLVRGWAQVLRVVASVYDPTFNPHALLACPTPPGGMLVPCADPNGIKDPAQRASYAAALATFHHYLKQRLRYQQIHNLDQGAMSNLSLALDSLRKLAPDGTPADFVALDGILQQAGLSDARRTKIDAMLCARPGI
ncbi:MAG TPA: hypothetical protein VIG32_10870 [Candidatus Baltobacteraceae bacterium]